MVLQFFKFFGKKQNENQISLFVNNKKHVFKHLGFVNDFLVFQNGNEMKFLVFELENINLCKNEDGLVFEFSFTYKKQNYFVVSNFVLNDLIDELKNLIKPKKILFECKNVKYFIFNAKKNVFEQKEKDCTIKISKEDCSRESSAESENVQLSVFYLKIDGSDSFLVHQEEILSYNQFRTDPNERSFIWSLKHENSFYTFKIQFEENFRFLEFLSTYISCISEPSSDGTADETVNRSYKSSNSRHVNDSSSGFVSDKASFITIGDSTLTDNNNYEDNPFLDESSTSEENETLAIGTQNKAFISRGSKINIYDTSENRIDKRGCLEYKYTPQKIIQNDNTLMILDKENKNSLYRIDLVNEKICDVWQVNDTHDHIGTRDTHALNDFFGGNGRLNSTNNFIAVSDNSLYQIDTRKDKIDLQNNYKTKVNFKCGISNNKGEFAIGNKKGELRLYDKLDKRAKVLLKGLGNEITGIDTTQNGDYLLCTCKNYLILYAINKENKEKPEPIKLQLKNEHLNYFDDIKFTTAKFNNNHTNIITSTGKFIITWQLLDILNGNLYNYSVKKCKDFVVDGDFDLKSDKIIVAMKDKVKLYDKSKMRNSK